MIITQCIFPSYSLDSSPTLFILGNKLFLKLFIMGSATCFQFIILSNFGNILKASLLCIYVHKFKAFSTAEM